MKQMHLDLMRGIDGRNPSGEWREGAMWVHSPVSDRISAAEVAAEEVAAAMQQFQSDYLSDGWQAVHPLIHSALVHLELARIHPFRDGNGRLGRMLLQLLLARRQVPLLPWELTLLRQRPAYLAAIEEAISTKDPTSFLRFLLDAAGRSIDLGFEMAAALRREQRSLIKTLVHVLEAPWHAQLLAEWVLVHVLTDGGPHPHDPQLRLPDGGIDGLDLVYFEGWRCLSSPLSRSLLRLS
jgi:Fic family protein